MKRETLGGKLEKMNLAHPENTCDPSHAFPQTEVSPTCNSCCNNIHLLLFSGTVLPAHCCHHWSQTEAAHFHAMLSKTYIEYRKSLLLSLLYYLHFLVFMCQNTLREVLDKARGNNYCLTTATGSYL